MNGATLLFDILLLKSVELKRALKSYVTISAPAFIGPIVVILILKWSPGFALPTKTKKPLILAIPSP